MKYRYSPDVDKILYKFNYETTLLMKKCLENYFVTGVEPKFEDTNLKDIWFYLKVHELSYWVERRGYDWFGSFEHLELLTELNKHGAKFSNRNYRLV